MKVTIEFNVGREAKALVKYALNQFSQDLMNGHISYPEPSCYKTERGFVYETASAKGEYNFDFSHRGRIIVSFEGYRNSLKGGTYLFNLAPVAPAGAKIGELKNWTLSMITEKAEINIWDGVLTEHFTSAPDKPLSQE